MTPKEKAKELVWKYYHQIEHTMSNEYSDKCWELSKQCALIVVDYMDESCGSALAAMGIPAKIVESISVEYLEDLKKEIEAL